jgi:tetratricopeptide (TPR) repeat protein
MRKLVFVTVLSLSLLLLLSLRRSGQSMYPSTHTEQSAHEADRYVIEESAVRDDPGAIGCAPSTSITVRRNEQGKFAPLFSGWGHYSYKVITNNDSAQLYFDQGLNLYYSYHLTEALASFREAARFDPTCTMAYWGQALAMGPYYNSYVYKMPVTVLPVLEQMNRLSVNAPGKERALVKVMGRRYSPDSSDSRRKQLNRDYAEGLASLMNEYPDDIDIKALYIDAVMLEHSWDFWTTDGQPKAWTNELVDSCDAILKFRSSHPAALHYKIHLVEASRHPERALAAADSLQTSMPGVPHMVHMSSHMYQRNGLYAQGIDVNDKASQLAVQYDTVGRNLNLGLFAQTHFDGVETYCALNANMYGKAIQTSYHLRRILLRSYKSRLANPFFQYLYMLPMLTYVRSGKWKVAMDEPAPDGNWHYASLLYEFGKGMACLRLHKMDSAEQHLARLRVWLKDSSLTIRIMPFNAPIEAAKIAESILAGEICLAKKDKKGAVRWLEKGVAVEDGMIYREPKDWPIPVRHYLGACLLKLNRPVDAEKVYQEDLVHNPGNGWASLGLAIAIAAQPQRRADLHDFEGDFSHAAAMRAFAKAEEVPTSSVY